MHNSHVSTFLAVRSAILTNLETDVQCTRGHLHLVRTTQLLDPVKKFQTK